MFPHPTGSLGGQAAGADPHPEDTPGHEPFSSRSGSGELTVPGKLNCFCWRGHCGEGCSGDGGVALGGSGGAGEEGVEEVVEEGLLLESGW